MINKNDILILKDLQKEFEYSSRRSMKSNYIKLNLDFITVIQFLSSNNFNLKHKNFILDTLKKCGDLLSTRGCNDFYFPKSISFLERKEYVRLSYEINGDIEEFEEYCSRDNNFEATFDFIIMSVLLYKLDNFFNELMLKKIASEF